MPKKITNVQWSASNVPDGVSFDTQTGTLSGTPSVLGEYTVPVKVTTNYGTDQKDVKIIIMKAYPVYAIGSKAATWSENAEADANGFRKLNMPNAYKLIFGQKGFGAKCTDGNYYACGNYDVNVQTGVDSPKTVNKPTKITVEDGSNEIAIDDMRFGRIYVTNTNTTLSTDYEYFLYVMKKLKNGKITCSASPIYSYKENRNSSGTVTYHNEQSSYPSSGFSSMNTLFFGFKLPDVRYMDWQGFGFLSSENTLILRARNKKSAASTWNSSEKSLDYDVKKYFVRSNKDVPILYSYLTNGNKLIPTESADPEDFPYGDLKDAWCYNKMAFAVTENNELYAKGTNSYNQLGLPNTTTYNDWEKVGNFDVKRIEMSTNKSFLLTNDGKLYFAGSAISDVVPENHSEFTQIFPDYYFQDIAYSPTGSTLIVTMEE